MKNVDPAYAKRFRRLQSEMTRELKENILPYWIRHAPDPERGGFHGHLTHRNEVVPGAGRGAVLNARILWTFSAAWRRYGNREYADMAKRALDTLTERFLDRERGGVFWELDPDGRIRSARKQIYALAFTIYGLAEYHLASGDRGALEEARSMFRLIEQRALDRRRNGYIEAFGREWSPLEDMRLSEKDANESKTMNTHLHLLEAYTLLCRVWRDPEPLQALENLIRLFVDRFTDPESGHLHLFFDDAWNLRSTTVSYGHDIECSWLLTEAAEVHGSAGLKKQAGDAGLRIAGAALEGLGKDGGLAYEYHPGTGRLDTERHWWPQAEAVVGFFNAFQLSGDHRFLYRAEGSWDYIREHLVDRHYGEWFWSVSADGTPQTENEKAGFWKCPYHNGRACMEIDRRIGSILGDPEPETTP